MEFENDNFSVIVPDYLINENEESENDLLVFSEENEEVRSEEEENEESENDLLVFSEENEEVQSEEEENEEVQNDPIDYSSILLEMNNRLENIETYTVAYNEGINGLLANLYFIDFVAFTVFVFLMLFIVIKFFKTFF